MMISFTREEIPWGVMEQARKPAYRMGCGCGRS
jgi:hypothetical protein